jgi:hypothetical protein
LDDAVRCGVATHTGRAKLISALDTLCNACAVESEYTNLSIIDIFRMPPKLRVIVFNGFVVVNNEGIEIPTGF